MIVKEMILVLQGWEYVRYVMTKRLTASSCPVDMPEHVRDVLLESRTPVNLVLTVGKEYPQHTIFICNSWLTRYLASLLKLDIIDLLTL